MDYLLLAVYVASFALALAYALPLVLYGRGVRRTMTRTSDEADTDSVARAAGENVPAASIGDKPFVSVVIAARNEERDITSCLESLLDSTYPNDRFEVIVVNDGSADDTLRIASAFSSKHALQPSFRVVSVPQQGESQGVRTTGHKKAALAFGILHSRGTILALTDADCRLPAAWLDRMVESFDSRTGFVAGPVAFSYGKTIFSRIVALEFMGLAGISAGSIGIGEPASCSGASVAFRRDVYDEVGGYTQLGHLSSGDDELLMQRIDSRTNWRIRYCAHRDATVVTRPPDSVDSFLRQRTRWASKAAYYEKPLLKAMYASVYLFILSLPVLMIAAFYESALLPLGVFMLVVKIAAERRVLVPAAQFFGGQSLMRYHIPAQPFQVAYVLWAGITGLAGNYEWKSRTITR